MTREEAFETWWREQVRKGDPAYRPNLVRTAFYEAFDLGRKDCEIEMEAAGFRQE